MIERRHINILGGGPAGLATGFFAHQKGYPYTIFEGRNRTGGNSVTLKYKGFRFDSGAHRFHNRDPEVTKLIQNLMRKELKRISRPSRIWLDGRWIDFPIHILNLVKFLGLSTVLKALFEMAVMRSSRSVGSRDFETYAHRRYGRTLSRPLLLDYSEKLWGLPARHLSRDIAGNRLGGLRAGTIVQRMIKTGSSGCAHMEGEFLYPRKGIGMITDKLRERCDPGRIVSNARITRIFHQKNRISEIEINGQERVGVDYLISTLPMFQLIRILHPEPPENILEKISGIRFRNVILVVVFIARESVMDAATAYFPDRNIPFTRIHEPRNRSLDMAPRGKTSLVVEIPCFPNDPVWQMSEDHLVDTVTSHLVNLRLCEPSEILDGISHRMEHAYPILRPDTTRIVNSVNEYLARFKNLKTGGRNGSFQYSWIHDMIRAGKEMIDELPD